MIKFKTDRIEREWNSGLMDEKLKDLVVMLDLYLHLVHGIKTCTLTEIFRYHTEQEEYYKDSDKVGYSVHEFWRGVDIRSRDWPDAVQEDVVKFLNKVPYSLKHKTCLIHDIGLGSHLHCQVAA